MDTTEKVKIANTLMKMKLDPSVSRIMKEEIHKRLGILLKEIKEDRAYYIKKKYGESEYKLLNL